MLPIMDPKGVSILNSMLEVFYFLAPLIIVVFKQERLPSSLGGRGARQ